MRNKIINSLLIALILSIAFIPFLLVNSQDTQPIGTVTVFGDDPIPPVITSVIVNENLSSPWDQLAYDSSVPIIWFSNVKTFDSILNITVTATDNWGLQSFNTSTEWNDGINVTVGGVGDLQNTIQFNYTISNGETSSGNLTLEVYDTNFNKDQYFINVTIDNTSPEDFEVTVLFTTITDDCAFVNTTVTDLQSGLYGIGVTMGGLDDDLIEYYYYQQNYTDSGINQFCAFSSGLYRVYAQAYDYVGNLKNATNNGVVLIQVNMVDKTQTITGGQFDPLDLAEIVLDDIYFIIILILIGLFLLAILRRALKN